MSNFQSPAASVHDDESDDSRDLEVGLPGTDKVYPAPSRYDNVGPFQDIAIYGRAPWFDLDALEAGNIVELYADDGWLPGDIPLEATNSSTWRMQYAIRDGDLRRTGRSSIDDARENFARQAYKGLRRMLTTRMVSSDLQVDAIFYRTRGEVDYVDRLEGVTGQQLNRWRQKMVTSPNGVVVTNRAIFWDRAQIIAEFRYTRKQGDYWSYVKGERRYRSMYGQIIPYQCLTHLEMRQNTRLNGWIKLHRSFGRIEVPRGCYVETPPCVSYVWKELKQDENSGWWVPVFTEFICKTATFILQEVYDNYRLWALSADSIRCLRELDLSTVLGHQDNVDELHRLLDVIESTNFAELPSTWRQRGERAHDLSPGRVGPGADWVYYDPWRRQILTEVVARQKANEERPPIPDGHPTGFNFDFNAAGWNNENPAYVAAQNNADNGDDYDEDDPLGWEGDEEGPPDNITGNDGAASNAATAGLGVTSTAGGFVTTPSHPGYIPNANQANFNPAVMMPMQPPPFMGTYQGVGPNQMLNPGLFPHNPYAVEAVKQFLREIGVEESNLMGSWAELRMYMRGRLGQ